MFAFCASMDLAVPQTHVSEQSETAAAKTWNSLLSEVISATLSTFKLIFFT